MKSAFHVLVFAVVIALAVWLILAFRANISVRSIPETHLPK